MFSPVTVFILLNNSYVCSFCCHLDNDTIYWVDMGLSTISRAKRDQTWREDIITNGIGRVEGIAVDWIAGESQTQALLPLSDAFRALLQYQSLLPCSCVCCRKHLLDWPGLWCDRGCQIEWLISICGHLPGTGQTAGHYRTSWERVRSE